MFDEHLERLGLIFYRLSRANLKLKATKCLLMQRKITFLGSVISEDGIEPDPSKVKAVVSWPKPENLTEVRGFVALASYYRRHIQHFSEIARPLHLLTKKDVKFQWGDEQETAFQRLKQCLVSAPVLVMPDDNGEYILDTDASDQACGCVLQMTLNGVTRVVGYGSRVFSSAESRYCVTRKELAAVIYGLKHFRHLLLGRQFVLRTDHAALTYLMKTPEPSAQSARYLDKLAEYSFSIRHRAGALHRNADALSRRPCARDPGQPVCKQCGPEVAFGEAETAEARETEDVVVSSESEDYCTAVRIRPASGEVPLHLPEKQEVIDQQNKVLLLGL